MIKVRCFQEEFNRKFKNEKFKIKTFIFPKM